MEDSESGVTVVIGHSEGDRFSMRVLGRLHVGADDFWDGNWLITPLEVVAGRFTASVGASLRAEELRDLRLALEQLEADLQGEATLESMEGWLSLSLEVGSSGRLAVRGVVIDRLGSSNRLMFVIEGLDQSSLRGVIEELGEVERRFPVMGAP